MDKNRLNGKQLLVTGAGGFIGSHLVERLVDLGGNVRAFVRYNSRGDRGLLEYVRPDALSQIEIIFGDLQDCEAVQSACREVDIVFHLGALIAIPYSYLHPRSVVMTNVVGTLNILMAAREEKAARVIHTSTSEVYGSALYAPIDEKHPLQGQSPYSASKIGADSLAESFYRSYGLPVCTLRPFNTYGPRQSARAIIPTIITQALTGREIHLGDLAPRRDFTYISDTVEGFIKIAQAGEEVLGQEVNLGSGVEITVSALANKIFEILGMETSPEIVIDEERKRPVKSEVFRLLADNCKARELIGWSPQVPMDEGLRRTIDWIKKHMDQYHPEGYQV